MTPQQQRIALGKWAGTKCSGCNDFGYVTTQLSSIPDSDGSITRECECIPDYPRDLNAVHELEERLSGTQRDMFSHELAKLLSPHCNNKFQRTLHWTLIFRYVHATAAQRCEALLRTLNLWKD